MSDFSTDRRWLSINAAFVRAQCKLDRKTEECACMPATGYPCRSTRRSLQAPEANEQFHP